jgi:hypothetical protein
MTKQMVPFRGFVEEPKMLISSLPYQSTNNMVFNKQLLCVR